MANTSEYTRPLKKLEPSDPPCSMGAASSDSEYFTALATESERATTPAPFLSALMGCERTESGDWSCSVEDRIKRSKIHWSELAEWDSDEDEAVAEIDNVQVFNSLQSHPKWGDFFRTFGDGAELVVGEKFAEGAQAELFDAKIKWWNPKNNERDLKVGVEYVLKVFRKGTSLRRLRLQWPPRLFLEHAKIMERTKLGEPQPLKYTCEVKCGTLLKDGRFAFVMEKETGDLRSRIDTLLMTRAGHDCGPFPKHLVEGIMYRIALGIDCLHKLGIVHRDLKSSNVLVHQDRKDWYYYVADFECSIGVVGTGFFRAPEILQACKDKVVEKRPDLFTKAIDVYSYGMTCYEILTGKHPFEGHSINDYDVVLKGQRPKVPKYVDEWVRELVERCWQFNPEDRPTFGEILNVILANSATSRKIEEESRRYYEEYIEMKLSGQKSL